MAYFDQKLKALCKNRDGISPLGRSVPYAELGAALKITRRTVGRYCNGKAKPDIGTFKCIANYFGVSYAFFLGEQDKQLQSEIVFLRRQNATLRCGVRLATIALEQVQHWED